MIIGILKCKQENLVAMVPRVISKLIKDDVHVIFEPKAGANSGYRDSEFEAVGAISVSRKEILKKSDILLTVSKLKASELPLIKEGTIVIGKFDARKNSKLVNTLRESNLNAFSLDLLPRTQWMFCLLWLRYQGIKRL
jgi:NAD(P) transhydrogenase subunit alpha